jgi:hypothetical protein
VKLTVGPKGGSDNKTNWPSDRRSQNQLRASRVRQNRSSFYIAKMTDRGKRRHFKMELAYTVSQDWPWLWGGDSSGNPHGSRQPLESGTSGLLKGQQTRKTQLMCSELQFV